MKGHPHLDLDIELDSNPKGVICSSILEPKAYPGGEQAIGCSRDAC